MQKMGEGVSRLFVQNFWSYSTENFVGEHFGVSENFGYRKILCIREGEYHVSPSTFCHTVPKNFVGTLRCIRKLRVSQSFMHKKRISLNSVENFLSHSAEKFRGHPFNVSENLGYRKVLWMKRGVSRFSVENFSHSAEKFRGHPFNVSENLGYRKILCIIGVSQFSVENFLSHCRKTS